MNGKKIYLAGPITGLEYEETVGWRQEFKDLISKKLPLGMTHCASPMRGKEYFKDKGKISVLSAPEMPLSTSKAIMTRDHWDCYTADIIVANLLKTTKISVGTVMEIAWSYSYKKPLILIMEQNNIHYHPMLWEAAGFHATTLEEGVNLVAALFNCDIV